MITIPCNNLELKNFRKLCDDSSNELNRKIQNGDSLAEGLDLERIVCSTVSALASGTSFQHDVKLISGHSFPDILVGDFFGIEVKSSRTGWRTNGGSVKESTRISGVERINLMYYNLKTKPGEVRTRPYEDCLYDIAVTHSPRYLIDMDLVAGKTIFDKAGLDYDEVRVRENPITPLLAFKAKHLKRGEETWWSAGASPSSQSSPFILRMFRDCLIDEKKAIRAELLLLFPEIFTSSRNKFDKAIFHLMKKHGILCHNVRDLFSAGGISEICHNDNNIKVSQILKTTYELITEIKSLSIQIPMDEVLSTWNDKAHNKDIDNSKIFYIWKNKISRIIKDNNKLVGNKEFTKVLQFV